ncbi:MAG: hypothetical protein ACTSUG_12545 [Candidatus Helarchaeota archaeon]
MKIRLSFKKTCQPLFLINLISLIPKNVLSTSMSLPFKLAIISRSYRKG